MTRIHSLPLFAVIAFLSLLPVAVSEAGGSIGWEDVQTQIAKDDAFMAKFIEKHFDVSPVGGGTRIGAHIEVDPDWKLLRLPPFEFTAKPKGDAGEPTLVLILEPTDDDLWTVTVRKRTEAE